jgi:hypothetical protein
MIISVVLLSLMFILNEDLETFDCYLSKKEQHECGVLLGRFSDNIEVFKDGVIVVRIIGDRIYYSSLIGSGRYDIYIDGFFFKKLEI